MTVDRLIDLLWTDVDLATGRNRLATTMHRMRRTLGLGRNELVAHTGDMVHVEVPADWQVDWHQFHTALNGDPAAQPTALTRILAPLASAQFAYDDALAQPRHRLVATASSRAAQLHAHGHLNDEQLDAVRAALDR